jgi:tetrapyrrole methylase family protein/MazG family protein
VSQFERLIELVARLRGPEGCPWDRAQTHQTLKGMLLEEAHEAIAAIEESDPEALQDELGDLLLHVLFHAQIARESGQFTIEDVVEELHQKLIRRHPHVFGKGKAGGVGEIRQRWEEIKRGEGKTLQVSEHLPALLGARKAQDRLANLSGEEVDHHSLKSLLGSGKPEEEIGRLLFRAVALARELGVEPELALHSATKAFLARS